MTARATRAAVALVAAALVWLGHSAIAWSHALLLESSPRPDEAVPSRLSRVVLRFNSRIEKALSKVSLVDRQGRRVLLRVSGEGEPDQVIAPLPTLAPGAYVLEWQVLSVDGHLTRGSFPFRVALAS